MFYACLIDIIEFNTFGCQKRRKKKEEEEEEEGKEKKNIWKKKEEEEELKIDWKKKKGCPWKKVNDDNEK